MPFSIVNHEGSHNTRVSKNTQKRLTFNSTKEDEVSSSRDETRAGGDDDVEEEEQSTCMGLSRRSWTEPKLMHCRSNPWRIFFREDDASAFSFFISSLLHLSLFKAFPFDKGAREDQGDKRAETETGEGEVRDDTMVLYLSVFPRFKCPRDYNTLSLCVFPILAIPFTYAERWKNFTIFFFKLLNPKNRIFNDKDPTAPPCRSVDEAFAQPSKERACCSLKSHQISPNKSSNTPPNPEAIYQETVITKIYELPRVTSMPVPTFQAQRKASATTQTFTLCCGFGED
jgi:hypothetical protein